jgi:PIN domain nuclease of toxin-antitoxin system
VGRTVKLLLDTHAALWWWEDSPALGDAARKAMADPGNEIFFSAASAYEIFQKVRLGRLTVPAKLAGQLTSVVRDEGWVPLPLTIAEAARAASIKHEHRDPFDRMLAAQCQIGHFLLASADGVFDEMSVKRIW